jgi:GNAT superfamily N-acetyltransferase
MKMAARVVYPSGATSNPVRQAPAPAHVIDFHEAAWTHRDRLTITRETDTATVCVEHRFTILSLPEVTAALHATRKRERGLVAACATNREWRMRRSPPMGFEIRPYGTADAGELVRLSLRAWEPVFESLRSELGSELFASLRGEDWRTGQAADVRKAIEAEQARTWVVEVDEKPRGFGTAALAPGADLGEILMVAVDPSYQRRGLGTALIEVASAWLRDQGAITVMIETGGDPGHAPARCTYERAGFHPLPVTRYFKML